MSPCPLNGDPLANLLTRQLASFTRAPYHQDAGF